ncbi:MAG: hypothetical protein ACI9KN_001587 [Gammaproteobacteria bacterium]|jgi:hypothetical protein
MTRVWVVKYKTWNTKAIYYLLNHGAYAKLRHCN